MNQPTQEAAAERAARTPGTPSGGQSPSLIASPAEVAARMTAQVLAVNAKKDELAAAIQGLTEMTQQLARAYAGQVYVIAQLVKRVKTLEAPGGDDGGDRRLAA